VAASKPAQASTTFSAPLTGGTDFVTGFTPCGGPNGIGPIVGPASGARLVLQCRLADGHEEDCTIGNVEHQDVVSIVDDQPAAAWAEVHDIDQMLDWSAQTGGPSPRSRAAGTTGSPCNAYAETVSSRFVASVSSCGICE
jgi:hypothetical protein